MEASSQTKNQAAAAQPPGLPQEFLNGLENIRRVIIPPPNWNGPPPPNSCEICVSRIPKNINEQMLIQPFLRFGPIYEMRLPLDHHNQTLRGFAYIRYTNEMDAQCAIEVMSQYYILPHRKLELLHSNEKRRLCITNIPTHINENELEIKFREFFPRMESMFSRGNAFKPEYIPPFIANNTLTDTCNINNNNINSNNRNNDNTDTNGGIPDIGAGDCIPSSTMDNIVRNDGRVILQFASHLEAFEVKRKFSYNFYQLYGRTLKVHWETAEDEMASCVPKKTLFVRNIHPSANRKEICDFLVKIMPSTSIKKINKIRTTAFFHFTTVEAAQICMNQCQGILFRGNRLELDWARPIEQQIQSRNASTDYDSLLRLKCISNVWHIPIVIFGTYYENENLQYAVILLRDTLGVFRSIYCIMQLNELIDIHARICEVACILIETIGTFPDYNYVFYVKRNSAHLLGMVAHTPSRIAFFAASGVPFDFHIDINEIIDLAIGISLISSFNEDILLQYYHQSFRTTSMYTYLPWLMYTHRIFGTIMPRYRNKPALKYDLNNTQIVLALCFTNTGTNLSVLNRPHVGMALSLFNNNFEGLCYIHLKLVPTSALHARNPVSHLLNFIQFGGVQYYHPEQRFMVPPMWITGHSYFSSMRQIKYPTSNNEQLAEELFQSNMDSANNEEEQQSNPANNENGILAISN